jgi:hypothetical protein
MGQGDDPLPMLDMSCPEFYITTIGRIESAGGDNLRLFCCVQRGNALEPICTLVIPMDLLAANSRQCLHAVADHHNQLQLFAHPPPKH